jgi:hypothetical protein
MTLTMSLNGYEKFEKSLQTNCCLSNKCMTSALAHLKSRLEWYVESTQQ